MLGSLAQFMAGRFRKPDITWVRPGRAAILPDGIVRDVFDRRKAFPQRLWSLQIENCGSSLSNRVKHHALAQSLREVVPLADTAD